MTLTVTDDDHDGELTPVASFAKQGEPGTVDALVWNNVYTTTGTLDGAANLTGTKALAGRDWKDGESFTFALAGADARTSAALGSGEVSFAGQPEHTTSVTTTAANPTDGTAHFAFGDLVFTKATAAGDPYRFVIAEVPNDEATNPAVGAGQTRYADATDDEKSLPGWTYEGISYDAQRYTVNVRVVDNGDGTLTATAASTGGSSAFTNAYTSEQPYSGAVDLSVVKTLTGHDLAAGQFTFVVAPGSDKAAQKIGLADASATMTFANDQAAASGAPSPVALPDALKNLTFDQDDSGETFTYTVSEQNAGQTLGGYTYDDASYTVAITPTDNGDGTLSIETVVTDASGAQTTHAWTTGQDPAAVTLAFANSYAGSGELVADVADGSGATKKTYTFTWQVAETTASTEAMAASPAVYDLTVTVTDNDDGTLGVAVAYPQGADEALPFVNVEPKKTVSGTEADGSAVVGKELTYTIAYTNNETTPATVTVTDAIPDNTQIVSAAGEGATVTYTVDGQEVATLPADLSTVEGATWTVANVQPGASGTVTLTVTVLPSAVSTSVTNQATVKIGDHDPGVKTNTVPTEVKGGALVVSKTVVGGDPEQLFDFGITLTDAQGAPLSGTYSDVTFADGAATVRLKGGESKRIEGLPAGASYHVTETPAAGYTADHTSQTGSIPAGGEATAAFTNTYNAEVDYGALGGLALTKTLEGHEVHDGQFSFVVAATDAQADPLGMGVDGTTFTTEAAADGATQTIDVLSGKQVTFTQDDAGKTYVYTVQEKGADGAGYDMDTDVRTVSIHVTDNKNGTMTVTTTVTGGPEGEKTHAYTTGQTPDETAVVPFVNTYAPSDASVALSTTKALTGRDLTAGEFSFELVPGGGDTAVATATNDAQGNVDFGTVEFSLDDLNAALGAQGASAGISEEPAAPGAAAVEDADGVDAVAVADGADAADGSGAAGAGAAASAEAAVADETVDAARVGAQRSHDFVYTITESGSADGVANDPDATRTVTFTVTDDGQGHLTVTRKPAEGAAFTFTNTYTVDELPSSVTDQISVSKELTGRDQTAGEFSFELVEGSGADATVVATGVNAADGTVAFTPVTYTAPGEHDYSVREVASGAGGVTYDTTAWSVHTSVVDNGDGTLTAAHGLTGGASGIVFKNAYQPAKATWTPSATKQLTGADLADGQFSFELKDADGNVVGEATNTASGAVMFDPVEFAEAGTYTYTISEKNDGQEHVTYDDHVVTVTVTVTDDLQGSLHVQTAVDGELVFNNAYDVPEGPGEGDEPGPGSPADVLSKTGDYLPIAAGVIALVAALAAAAAIAAKRRASRPMGRHGR